MSCGPDGGGESRYVIFNFLKGDDMFYSALGGNSDMLDSLSLETALSSLEEGSIRVDGYGDDLEIVKIRCSRVKSELIVRYGLKEESFVTSLMTGTFNGVHDAVVITLPAPVTCSRETQPEDTTIAGAGQTASPEQIQPEESAPADTVRTAEETLSEETVCTVPEEKEEPANNLPPETTHLSDNPVTEPERPKDNREDGFRGRWQAGLNAGIPFFWGDMLSMSADKTYPPLQTVQE